MEKTTRRNILKAVAAGGAAAGFGMVLKSRTSESAFAQGKSDEAHGKHGPNVDGPLANAIVSFGQWRTDLNPPLDRRLNPPPAPTANQHLLIPFEPTIRAGGAVIFAISGFHNVVVYDHGTQPSDIKTNLTIPMAGPPGLPLIDDPNKRIYRGPDPSLLTTQDRVETVTLGEPGIYLVICGFLFHFQDNMFGYVKVVP